MDDVKVCPECGGPLAYNRVSGGLHNCLNPDCIRMFGFVHDMSAAGIVKQLRAVLALLPDSRRDPEERWIRLDGIALPRLVAYRIAELLDPLDPNERKDS